MVDKLFGTLFCESSWDLGAPNNRRLFLKLVFFSPRPPGELKDTFDGPSTSKSLIEAEAGGCFYF
jgi:hypothetical protein